MLFGAKPPGGPASLFLTRAGRRSILKNPQRSTAALENAMDRTDDAHFDRFVAAYEAAALKDAFGKATPPPIQEACREAMRCECECFVGMAKSKDLAAIAPEDLGEAFFASRNGAGAPASDRPEWPRLLSLGTAFGPFKLESDPLDPDAGACAFFSRAKWIHFGRVLRQRRLGMLFPDSGPQGPQDPEPTQHKPSGLRSASPSQR